MRQSFINTVGLFFLVGILLNIFLPSPHFTNFNDEAAFELKANQPQLAENTLLQILAQDSSNIENHYRYIYAHFKIPKKSNNEYRDDRAIQKYYNSLAVSMDSNMHDIGYYGKGLIESYHEHYHQAVIEFSNVKNRNLKYLNNSIAYAFIQMDSLKMAEHYLRKEIAINGNLEAAYSNLIKVLIDRNETKELRSLLNNEKTRSYFPYRLQAEFYFKIFEPINYVQALWKEIFSRLNIYGIAAAFLIMLSWMVYLHKLDIFEIDKWSHMFMTVAAGMVFSLLVFPISHLNNLIFDFRLNGGLINDFLYSVFGIGAIEEFVKIIPLLLLLKFTKVINEPYHYIKYASLSALGFATMENLIYFSESNLQIIHGRALITVVVHMFMSSIIAYGLILNKYKWKKNPYLNFIYFFIIAASVHGLFDFWLINKSVSDTSFFLIIIFLFSIIHIWNTFINNSLNNSQFYDMDKSIDKDKLQDYLFYSLSFILLFEYVALAFKFSPDVANNALWASFYGGTIISLYLAGNLSQFNFFKGEWAEIKYWGNSSISYNEDETEDNLNYSKDIGIELWIEPYSNNEFQDKFLPNNGVVFKTVTVSKVPGWYLVKLNLLKEVPGFSNDIIVIKAKEQGLLLKNGKKRMVAFFIIPHNINIENEDFGERVFKFCGWAIVQ